MATKAKSFHVVRNPGSGWSVTRAGSERAAKVLPTKQEAVKFARDISSGFDADVVVHREDGRISKYYSGIARSWKDAVHHSGSFAMKSPRPRSSKATLGGTGMDQYHLTKKGSEWRLEKAGSNRAVVKAGTKEQAVQQMRGYMKGKEGSVVIHKQNGRIQEERTYPRSKDPRGSKG